MLLKKLSLHSIFTVSLLLSVFLNGCAAAQVAPAAENLQSVGFYSTLVGIRSAVAGNPGTFLMEGKDAIVAVWPSGSNYAFASFCKDGKPVIDLMAEMGMNGQKTDAFTMSSLVQHLEANGWKYVTPDKLPVALLATLRSYAAVTLTESTQIFPTVLVVPLSPSQMAAPLPDTRQQ